MSTMSNPKSAADVLKSLQSEFRRRVVAKAIAQEARGKHIIPACVETDILRAKERSSANYHLFEHLCSQVTVEDLRKLCSIMKDAEGYSLMNGFGNKLEDELDVQEEAATGRSLMQQPRYGHCGADALPAENVLKQADFMNCVIAKAIAQEARREHIIPTTVETDIRNAKDQSSANDYLFEHLRSQATVEDLRKLCNVMKDAEGYRIMNGFGKKLEAELDNLPSEQPTQTLSPPLNTTVATTASFAAASTAFGLPHRENQEPRWTRNQRNEDEEDSRECHRRRGYDRPRSPLNQRKEKAATGRSLMEQARCGFSEAGSGAFSLPVETHGPDSPKEPQVSFAILTANKNENAAVHHFLKLGNPTDTKKYRYAKGHTWSDYSFLIQTNTKIEPNEGKSENPYRVFDLEVGEKRQMGVHVACDMIGPWGAFETTVKLLEKAKEKGWKLGCIFVIGCCGASVINRKECPRGTVLLANEVTDYLNTGKVVEEVVRRKVVGRKVSGTPLNIPMDTMCPRGLHEFENVQTADRLDPHRIEVQIVDFLTGPLVIKDDLFGKAYCKANAKVTGVEMEIVGVIRAVKAFHHISGDPEQKVVLAKGVSDYTGKEGEKGKCKLFGVETPIVDDDQLQMYAALQSLALVIRFVAKNMPLILDQST